MWGVEGGGPGVSLTQPPATVWQPSGLLGAVRRRPNDRHCPAECLVARDFGRVSQGIGGAYPETMLAMANLETGGRTRWFMVRQCAGQSERLYWSYVEVTPQRGVAHRGALTVYNQPRPPLGSLRSVENFPVNPHLTTHHPVINCKCSSDPPVRVPVAYAIRRLCDIVCPPGGRTKSPCPDPGTSHRAFRPVV